MANLSVELMRQVDWNPSILWDVEFTMPNSQTPRNWPFKGWISAMDVEEDIFGINTKDIQIPLGSIRIPESQDPLEVKITFADDIYSSIIEWLRMWKEEVFPGGNTMGYMDEYVRMLTVKKLRRDKTVLSHKSYLVWPSSKLTFQGRNEQSLAQYPISFQVAAVIK